MITPSKFNRIFETYTMRKAITDFRSVIALAEVGDFKTQEESLNLDLEALLEEVSSSCCRLS